MTVKSRMTEHPAGKVVARNVITVASGKGGVGKTWLSITLAHALARLNRKTLLFDGDFGLANVDVQLNLATRHDLAEVVAGEISLGQAITPFDAGGFDIVAGKSGSGALAGIRQRHFKILRQALALLAMRYDKVIVDMGAGVDNALTSLTGGSGTTVVLVTDEPTSLTDAYAYVKLALRENAAADVRIVVNMADDARSGERTYQALANACRNFLNQTPPFLGIIRRDDKVRDSIRRQSALLVRHPTSNAASDVEKIARSLSHEP